MRGGFPTPQSAPSFADFTGHDGAKEKAAADVTRKRYGLGMPISFQADRSLDRGLRVRQVMLLSFVGKSGFKETCLPVLDLRELDMTKSKDGPPEVARRQCNDTLLCHGA